MLSSEKSTLKSTLESQKQPKNLDFSERELSMATVIKNTKDGKVISYKFRAYLGKDELGKQIAAYTTWNIPDGFTPSKAEKAAKKAAADWEKQVKAEYEKDLQDPDRVKAREIDKKRTEFAGFVQNTWFPLCVQAATFFTLLPKCPVDFRCMLHLLITTGLRRGELLGLQWKDIDFEGHTIEIKRNITYTPEKGLVIDTPKTENSERIIPLLPYLAKLLKEYKKDMYPFSKAAAFVFPSKDSDTIPRDPNAITRKVKCFMKKHNLPDMSPHDLRHPYVKHTTKIFSLRLKVFQAQPVPDALRKIRGAFLHLREGGSHNPFLRSCNKKLSPWSIPQSKMSLILYAISMRLSGYTSTLSMRRSVSSVVSPSELKTAFAASCRLSCRACSSCFCFACANTTA